MKHRTFPSGIAVFLTSILLGLTGWCADENPVAGMQKSAADIGFLRFVDKGPENSWMDTALVSYSHPEGRTVDLIAVIHIADLGYFQDLNERFKQYDALLYELIAHPSDAPSADQPSASGVSSIQRLMKNVLNLTFQLDVIDYSAANFVHADMDPDTFRTMQRQKGESLFGLMMKSMLSGWEQQTRGDGPQMTVFQLMAALASKDRAMSLKYLLARDFERMEDMLESIDESEDGDGSVILSGRNKVAIEVLKKETAKGKKKLGIFYGAGHMPDLERRLFELGYRFERHRWMRAWDISSGGSKVPVGNTDPKSLDD